MEADRPVPQPITPEAKPYWDGLKEGKLMLPRCGACGHAFFYPRILCPRCQSRDITWFQASGKGRLHAFGIGHQSFNKAFKVPAPYVLAMIELEEGPRMMSNLINMVADPAAITCDMPVQIVFHKLTDDVTVSLWEPAKSADRAGQGVAR
jgi:uncharacterized OB-fold protein